MSAYILTITLNPAIDRIIRHDRGLSPVGSFAGGKGVNVARAFRALGIPARAIGLAGGPAGRTLDGLLDREGIPHRFFLIQGDTRTNVTMVRKDGVVRRKVVPGPRVTREERDAFAAFFTRSIRGAGAIIFSGSLPLRFPVKAFVALVRRAQASGALTVVDACGPALRAALGLGVDVIKPNREEAEEVLGFKLSSRARVTKALRTFAGYGIKKVLISLGRDGMAASDGVNEFFVRVPVVSRGHMVGCGDAALAGFLAEYLRGRGLAACAARAAACGQANALADIPGGIDKNDIRHAFMRRKVTWL